MRSVISTLISALRTSASAVATVAVMAGRGVARTMNAAADVTDVLFDAAGRVIQAPLAILGALKQTMFPVPEVPVAPAQAAASEVMSALQEARRKGPEQIIAEGEALQRHIEANPPRRSEYDTKASLARINQAFADAEKILHRKAGWEASAIAHWARSRVDGIATDAAGADISHLPPHLQVWARSLTKEQIAEVARMPRQMLHHHLTSDDCHLWAKALPAAGLDTAERAKHGIRTAMAASRDGTVDPYPQQKALDGVARKRELDAFRDVEPLPVGPRI